MAVQVQFLGGLDAVFGTRSTAVELAEGATAGELVRELGRRLDAQGRLVFLEGELVRPGILVLVNDCDWELEGEEACVLVPGDVVAFTSTLHGG